MTLPQSSLPPTDPTAVVVAITRVEVKLDNLTDQVREHGKDIADLKRDKWPAKPAALLLSVLGSICGVVALIRGTH